jgi:colanic acid/amylovoran biosynthesis glycosyltransferase
MRHIIAYRDVLLPFSETFIPAQVESLSTYRGFYVGTKRLPDGEALFPNERSVILGDTVDYPGVWRGLFKAAGFMPRPWREQIEGLSPVLIHAHFGPDGLWALPLARRLRVPLLVSFHGYDITIDSPRRVSTRKANQVMHGLYLKQRGRVFDEARMCLACSKFIASQLVQRGCPEHKIRVHYIGIDLEKFSPDPAVAREPFVLFVGRLVEKKGCDLLIRAMSRVQKSMPEVELVIIGNGPLRSDLENLAAQSLTRYRFLGAQPPELVHSWMNRSLVFAAPSVTASTGETEGLPISILEAQAMGLPVVSSVHAGIPEAVIHGETGFLIEEGEWEHLAEYLSTLLGNADLRGRFAVAARRRVEQEFNLHRNARRLEEIYDSVLREES